MTNHLNIYHISEGSRALGPGLRYIIWVQGCMQHCEGCISPQSRPMTVNQLVSIETLTKSIVAKKNIDGITISGGEPFLQASKLTILLQKVKKIRPELTVMVYTGYTIKQLNSDVAKKFIQHIDLLIDGPYVDELNDEKGLRGSSNQKLHFLTDRLRSYEDELENGGRTNEIVIEKDGTHIIGIPRKDTKPSIINN